MYGNPLKMGKIVSRKMIISLDYQLLNYRFCFNIVSIMSFGHTGSGKTHSIFGNSKDKNPGFLPLILESIFAYIYEVGIIII